jgi:hypothetical protein
MAGDLKFEFRGQTVVLTRRLAMVLGAVAVLLTVVTYVLLTVSVATVHAQTAASNHTALESAQLAMLRAQTSKQESDLAYLLQEEQQQQSLLESELRDLQRRHEALALERERLRGNETALRGELEQLERVRDDLARLTRERDELQAHRDSLADEQAELASQREAFAAVKLRFEKEKLDAIAEQQKLSASVAKLERQNAALEAVSRRLNQHSMAVDADDAAKFVANLQPSTPRNATDSDADADADAAEQQQIVGAAAQAIAADDLSALERNTVVLNATLFKLVSEKLRLKDQLHKFVEIFTKLEKGSKLACEHQVDRARVHPVLSSSELNGEWRHCWKRPFLDLVKSYHCDQTWRQVLNTITPHSVVMADAPATRNGAVTVTLNSGQVGIFKACGASGLSEVAAYHIDRLFGFFRTPAAATRALPLSTLRGAVTGKTTPAAKANLGLVMAQCATPHGYLAGSMMGWSAEKLERLGVPLSDLVHAYFQPHWPANEPALLARRLEVTRYVMWAYVLNDFARLLRNGDTYIFKAPADYVAEGGPIVYFNNAGAQWHEAPSERSLLRASFNSTFCKRTGLRLECDQFATLSNRTTVDGDATDPLTLGEHYADMLRTVCMFERQQVELIRTFVATPTHQSPAYLLTRALLERELLDVTPVVVDDEWRRVEARIFWLRVRISECVQLHGEENVLFDQDVSANAKWTAGTRVG